MSNKNNIDNNQVPETHMESAVEANSTPKTPSQKKFSAKNQTKTVDPLLLPKQASAISPSRKPLYLMLAALAVIIVVLTFTLLNPGSKTFKATSSQNTANPTDSKSSESKSESTSSDSANATEADYPQASPRNQNATEIIKSITRARPDDPMAKGNLNAPVTMLQFEDYSCPMCTRFETEIAPALEKYVKDGTLRIEFHHLPIFSDRYKSDLAAEGAYAAGDQGKFWEYNHELYKFGAMKADRTGDGHVTWDKALLTKLAQQAGLDVARFEQDLARGNLRDRLVADYQKVANLFQGTPAFLINDRYIAGAEQIARFEDTIKAAKVTK